MPAASRPSKSRSHPDRQPRHRGVGGGGVEGQSAPQLRRVCRSSRAESWTRRGSSRARLRSGTWWTAAACDAIWDGRLRSHHAVCL